MSHQKRLPAPKHYPIDRKGKKYISTIKGSRSDKDAVPAVVFLREITGYAESEKEAKEIIRNGDLFRNGETLNDIKEGIGVLDVVEIPETEETYRVIKSGNGLEFVPVTDGDKVAAKIVGKDSRGDEYVYRLHSGENYMSEKEYSTGNTLVFNSSTKEVELEEGAEALVIEGKHAGELAEVQEINERGMNPNTATVESEIEFETRLENLVAVEKIQLGDR